MDRGVGVDPHAAEGDQHRLFQSFGILQRLLQRLFVFPRTPEKKVMGNVEARIGSLFMGMKDVFGAKRFSVSGQDGIAQGFRAELDVRQAGLCHDVVIIRLRLERGKKSAPGHGEMRPDKCFCHLEAVTGVAIEGGVGDEQVLCPRLLKRQGILCDLVGIAEPERATVDVGVRAVDAAVGTAPFGLKVEDAPPPEIVPDMGAVHVKVSSERPVCGAGQARTGTSTDPDTRNA